MIRNQFDLSHGFAPSNVLETKRGSNIRRFCQTVSQKYFECEVGYGIMVPFRKVKCIRSKHLDPPKKLESDAVVREVVELGRVLHKVSPGYQFVKHMQTTNSERVDEFYVLIAVLIHLLSALLAFNVFEVTKSTLLSN